MSKKIKALLKPILQQTFEDKSIVYKEIESVFEKQSVEFALFIHRNYDLWLHEMWLKRGTATETITTEQLYKEFLNQKL